MRKLALALAVFATAPALAKTAIPVAIYTDPARDTAHPARTEVLHIPTGDVTINGVAYLAAGKGPHPTLIICHGLPGIEKNLDLAQAARRAGWNAITFNYRGSWGSPGNYRFAQNLEDAAAVLTYIRSPTNAQALGIDTSRVVIAGHSMGGWVAAMTAGTDPGLAGAIMISAANMGAIGHLPRAALIKELASDMETLAVASPEALADDLIANAGAFDFLRLAGPLSRTPLLVLSSDDGFASMTNALASAVRSSGGKQVTTVHVATDHSWSDRRIRLQAEMLTWLARLK